MERIVERPAGLDVHKDVVVAEVHLPGGAGEQGSFATTTPGLLVLRDWLVAHGVTRVGIESTSVYWKCVYYMLEDVMEVWLLNARHMRNIPGRKTDVADAAWICQLIEFGWSAPRSCHRSRSASCATSPGTARRRSRNAAGRPNAWTKSFKTPV